MCLKSKRLLIFLICCSSALQAQKIEVLWTDRLTKKSDGEFVVSAVSPGGKSILASRPGYKGLYLIDIQNKNIVKLSDVAGAGFEPCFSADGSSVFFRSDEFSVSGRTSSLENVDLLSGRTEVLESRKKDLSTPVINNNKIVYSLGGKHKELATGQVNNKSPESNIYIMLENLKPVLYINGIKKLITPNGEGNYIWVSLSPGKNMILYNFQGIATYVCDLNGEILDNPGKINAPEWLNDKIIVGMDDKDDGYRVLSSDIICYSLITKKKTRLTSTSDKAEMYPLPFTGGKRLVYQTPEGELFLMTLSIK